MVQDIRDIITDVSVTADVTLVTVYNLPNKTEIMAKLFECLADEGVNVDMISLTPSQGLTQTVSFSASDEALTATLTTVGKIKGSYPDVRMDVNTSNCKLTFEGEAMKTRCGVAASVFASLGANGIEVKLITTSETKISCLVDEAQMATVYDVLEKVYGLTNC